MASLGTRALTLTVAATDYTAQVFNVELSSRAAEADQVTFAEAASGGAREYYLHFLITQDLVTTALWDKIWSAAGTSVVYVIRPYGNTTASVTQPHYSGNVIISEPDGVLIGGDADASATSRWQTEVEWVCTAKPTKVTS